MSKELDDNYELFCQKVIVPKLEAKVTELQKQNEILIEAVEYVNDVAPDMYEYNELELKMVMKAREALEKIKEME